MDKKIQNTIYQVAEEFQNHIWIILGICFTIYCIFTIEIFNISFGVMLRFVLLHGISIFLPGVAVLSFFENRLSRVTTICYAYAIGYVLVIIQYFFSELTGRHISFLVITVITGIISTFIIIAKIMKKQKVISFSNADSEFIPVCFVIIFTENM